MRTLKLQPSYRSPQCETGDCISYYAICASADGQTEPFDDSGEVFSW